MFTRRTFVKLASLASTLGMAISAAAGKGKRKKVIARIQDTTNLPTEFDCVDTDYDTYGDEYNITLTAKTKYKRKKGKGKAKKSNLDDVVEDFNKVKVVGKVDPKDDFHLTASSVTKIVPDYDY